jgi:hypothetical protein
MHIQRVHYAILNLCEVLHYKKKGNERTREVKGRKSEEGRK